MILTVKRIHQASVKKEFKSPLFLARISAGFPSLADAYLDKNLNLHFGPDLTVKIKVDFL